MSRKSQGMNRAAGRRTELVHTREQREAWQRAAEIEGSTLSDWIRRTLDRASGLAEARIQRAARRRAQK